MSRTSIRFGEKRPIPGINFSSREIVIEREIEVREDLSPEEFQTSMNAQLDELRTVVSKRFTEGEADR